MPDSIPPRKTLLQRFFSLLPLLIVVAGLSLTWQQWVAMRAQERDAQRAQFGLKLDQFAEALDHHLKTNTQVLLGTAGLFAASNEVTSAEFRAYVDAHHIAQTFPEIHAIGFTEKVRHPHITRHTERLRKASSRDYAIRPSGNRDFYAPVTHIVSSSGPPESVLGFDVASDPVRRKAMMRAANQGVAAMSSKLTFSRDPDLSEQDGVLIYYPVYQKDGLRQSELERNEALAGWVYSALNLQSLMAQLLDDEHSLLPRQASIQISEDTDSGEHRLILSRAAATAGSCSRAGWTRGGRVSSGWVQASTSRKFSGNLPKACTASV